MIPCIIPARGGSKGIPRKNLLPVGGKPLIRWSIDQALASSVSQVIVATDDEEIAAAANDVVGVTVFARSRESATDDSQTEVVLREVVLGYLEQAEAIVFLQPTSPVRQSDDIDKALDLFRRTKADSLFSARTIEGYTWNAAGRILQPRDGSRQPRQAEMRHNLEENGSIYIFKPSILMDHNNRLGGRIVPYIMHPLDSFQLDETDDISLIESLLEVRCGNHAAAEN